MVSNCTDAIWSSWGRKLKDWEYDGKSGREPQANDAQSDRTSRDNSMDPSLFDDFDKSAHWRKALHHPNDQEESCQHVCWNHLPPWPLHEYLGHGERVCDEYDVSHPARSMQSWNCEHQKRQKISQH